VALFTLESLLPLLRFAVPDDLACLRLTVSWAVSVWAETADRHQLTHLAPSTPFAYDFTNCVKGDYPITRMVFIMTGMFGTGISLSLK
jgi:hypothetical protein